MKASELKVYSELPKNLSPLLQAMWHDCKGDWQSSHRIAQDIHTRDGSWVHAYLHRKEGDSSNALYWYHQAGKNMPAVSLEKEWEEITTALLARE